jgi:hypothetical protein
MSDDPGGWQRYNIDRAIAYSIEAIKASLLINGAAAIALMAFLGAVAAPNSRISIDVHEIKYALITFGTGVAVCPVTFLFAYLAQLFFAGYVASDSYLWPAETFRWAALLGFVVSISLFCVGVFLAAGAITTTV